MTVGSDNPFPSVLFAEHVDPANPGAGTQRLFVDTDHVLKLIDSSGTVTTFTGASGAMATDALWDAAGDLAVGTGANTGAKLTKGSDGTLLRMASGAVGWGYTPFVGCFVYNSTTQSFAATTLTTITFDTDLYDTSAMHDTGSNTGRLVAPVTGYYRVSTNLWYATTSGINYILFEKNTSGAYIRGGAFNFSGAASGAYGSTTVLLTATDYLTVVGYHTQSGTLATGDTGGTPSQQNWAAMELIGV